MALCKDLPSSRLGGGVKGLNIQLEVLKLDGSRQEWLLGPLRIGPAEGLRGGQRRMPNAYKSVGLGELGVSGCL